MSAMGAVMLVFVFLVKKFTLSRVLCGREHFNDGKSTYLAKDFVCYNKCAVVEHSKKLW
jgi:hypothetical protein